METRIKTNYTDLEFSPDASGPIKDFKKIKSFNVKLYGKPKAQEISNAIFERLEILENPNYDFSEIGAIDEDFEHLKYDYQKLISIIVKSPIEKKKLKFTLSGFLINDKIQLKKIEAEFVWVDKIPIFRFTLER